MFKTIKNAWKTPELRKKIIYTIILIVIFRFGCYITVPGVDALALDEAIKLALEDANMTVDDIDTVECGCSLFSILKRLEVML